MIEYLRARRAQTTEEIALSGRDNTDFEGPFGEAMLPAPSVGYSRVVAKGIHSGRTNNGLVV